MLIRIRGDFYLNRVAFLNSTFIIKVKIKNVCNFELDSIVITYRALILGKFVKSQLYKHRNQRRNFHYSRI